MDNKYRKQFIQMKKLREKIYEIHKSKNIKTL